ncbi:DEAD/DEAH box helicase [Bacillus altitudinis MN12]|uniref:DEAD/DEAH box helicase n=1 Tax=Bacillus altitudinis TaxID=293387 RepID=UPI001B81F4F8|nr:type ISP restriction/modification enzyme [Bacillus altitudinis]MBR0584732.1 DEAD/DEAH box helicase [Bacillus altitudinis MN12]MBR0595793.1 DEAD/DEAH box helicase [Bacillus altitudinis C16B11]MBR0609765.1 DEAD/DEAH box helicase [Bacillus altitudinis]
MNFNRLIDQINKISDSQRLRGTYFEYLVQAYLKNEPMYKNEFENVWMLNEVPLDLGIPHNDTGVDLVAQKRTGELVAIQAKFYEGAIQKSNIDSFLGELGRSYFSSGIIVSSTDKWGKNAEQALADREDVIRIGLSDLRNSQIDWNQFSFANPKEVTIRTAKKVRKYQRDAINAALTYFEKNDRGQLIMAPGTGKTFTSLKLTEAMAKRANKEQFVVLYLVPSIQLLTQTLRGWNNDSEMSISSMAVTSDRNASRGKINQDETNLATRASDIGYPATTSYEKVVSNYIELSKKDKTELLVVFGTYQSIDVLGNAQKHGFPEFDLIIADEAHRTTGATALGEEDSAFQKVHSDNNVKGNKRLYQTATPKLYGVEAKKRAEESSVIISSMDDADRYGNVFYRLGFGDAISQDYLTDYKLMVLAVDESVIQKDMQKSIADPENGLGIDDIGRIIGIWNGMIKRETFSNKVSGAPMKRAIAFSRTIKDSQRIANQFENVVNDYLESEDGYRAEVRHVDGGMNALEKNDALDWLASEDVPDNSARILSNVRFLTEGIDVPNLDAIIFLSPRKSQVDIVQAVGRIIRKSPDKEYGYIILPIVIPAGETPETILDNNKTYDVIWQVLNALRSVDERFEATVNKLHLNKTKPANIQLIGVGTAPDDPNFNQKDRISEEPMTYQTSLNLEWEEVEGAIYGKIVQKVGDRRYLEDWSADVAKIAKRHMNYIEIIMEQNSKAKKAFDMFVSSLRHNINEAISYDQAIEMVAQHLITLPIFEALFDEYSFVRNNPVGAAMEQIIAEFSKFGFEKEQKELIPFYESVKLRAGGIDNAEAKQKIIVTLYDKFFSTGFKSTTERLGIVFTPIEVVDFIVKSVDDILEQHFGKRIFGENVHILDPFTGTGTFIVRTLSYLKNKLDGNEITLADLTRKYTHELHANEIVLLSYYIAAINIEATFDEINKNGYEPFKGIVLTDTFESTETEDTLDDDFFGTNDDRLKQQKKSKITAIIGNPPYSIGQGNANDDNQNISYPKLEVSIDKTYAQNSKSSLLKSLYDSYIKAFRWASDRIEDKGVIAFVSNGSFIDSASTDGFRASLYKEFNYVYVFNLRGDARTQGEKRKKEAGNIFGSGSRTPIALTVLIKDGSNAHQVFYKDIGDYLNQEQKLSIIKDYGSIANIDWTEVIPDANNDWINQRDTNYETYLPMDGGYFNDRFVGVNTARDEWVYSFNTLELREKVYRMTKNFNEEVDKSNKIDTMNINTDPSFIKWSVNLRKKFESKQKIVLNDNNIVTSIYRPFVKKYLYYQTDLIERPGRSKEVFEGNNLAIYVTGKGASREFSAIMVNCVPNFHLMDTGQGFYLKNNAESLELFAEQYNITDSITEKLDLTADDVFYYIYGLLHSQDYKEKYVNELRKDLPRIPIVANKEIFVAIGRKLANLHLNYETVEPSNEVNLVVSDDPSFKVKKMKFIKRSDKSTIIFNSEIRITDIPDKAYDYIVNGKPAIQWILEQYSIPNKTKSGNIDDPNTYSTNSRYVLDLLLSVINVSVQTVDLVNSLPPLEIIE